MKGSRATDAVINESSTKPEARLAANPLTPVRSPGSSSIKNKELFNSSGRLLILQALPYKQSLLRALSRILVIPALHPRIKSPLIFPADSQMTPALTDKRPLVLMGPIHLLQNAENSLLQKQSHVSDPWLDRLLDWFFDRSLIYTAFKKVMTGRLIYVCFEYAINKLVMRHPIKR